MEKWVRSISASKLVFGDRKSKPRPLMSALAVSEDSPIPVTKCWSGSLLAEIFAMYLSEPRSMDAFPLMLPPPSVSLKLVEYLLPSAFTRAFSPMPDGIRIFAATFLSSKAVTNPMFCVDASMSACAASLLMSLMLAAKPLALALKAVGSFTITSSMFILSMLPLRMASMARGCSGQRRMKSAGMSARNSLMSDLPNEPCMVACSLPGAMLSKVLRSMASFAVSEECSVLTLRSGNFILVESRLMFPAISLSVRPLFSLNEQPWMLAESFGSQ